MLVQWLRLRLPMQGVWVQSLVGELRSHMPRGQRKQTYYIQKNKHKNTVNFSSETMQARRQWNNFKVLKKETVYLEFYTQGKYLSERKAK